MANLASDVREHRRQPESAAPSRLTLAAAGGGNRIVRAGIEIQVPPIDPTQVDERAHDAREIPELGRASRMVRGAKERQIVCLHVREAVGDPVSSNDEEIRVEDEQKPGRHPLDDLMQTGGMMPALREIQRAIDGGAPEHKRPFRKLRSDLRRFLGVVGDDDPLNR